MASIVCSHWLASCANGFYLFNDYNHLIFTFDPLFEMLGIVRATTRKVFYLTVSLSLSNYVSLYISDSEKFWADLMMSWTIRRRYVVLSLHRRFRRHSETLNGARFLQSVPPRTSMPETALQKHPNPRVSGFYHTALSGIRIRMKIINCASISLRTLAPAAATAHPSPRTSFFDSFVGLNCPGKSTFLSHFALTASLQQEEGTFPAPSDWRSSGRSGMTWFSLTTLNCAGAARARNMFL